MQLIPHSFNKYELSPEEVRAGQALTLTNKAVIHNLLAEIAEKKIRLVLDPQNMQEYIQQEAYLTGQFDILNFLLDSSESTQIPLSLGE